MQLPARRVLRCTASYNICPRKPDATLNRKLLQSAILLMIRGLQRGARPTALRLCPRECRFRKERSLNEPSQFPARIRHRSVSEALHHLGFTCMLHQMPVTSADQIRNKICKCNIRPFGRRRTTPKKSILENPPVLTYLASFGSTRSYPRAFPQNPQHTLCLLLSLLRTFTVLRSRAGQGDHHTSLLRHFSFEPS
jgi:hypothetical protein